AERRLRVAYLSRDLRHHSVQYFLLPILSHHDHAAFEIVCYSDNKQADEVTELFKVHADRWVECDGWSDEELAGRIRRDGIDLLIDLGGHTDRNRLPVLARRPAPLQIGYLGYPSTTGVSTIDYRISDRWIDPEPPDPQILRRKRRCGCNTVTFAMRRSPSHRKSVHCLLTAWGESHLVR
ncbi:MAG: hypothetical protein IPJ27_19890, partial [Candidatus Accumulibacter sp.]|nr:hypothetical protein [Candidatus Accumulibacter proximus]